MRSGGTVQRSSFTSDQPRLTALAGQPTANTATGQPDANPATSYTGNGTASLATDAAAAAAESSTRTTTDASLTTKAGTTAETGPGPKVAPTRPKARPELTPARPESTPTWPETSSVPAETGLPTKPPRAPIPAISQSLGGVDEWGKGITHQRAAVLRHRRNGVRPVAVLVGQNLLQAADRVATEIHTRHGSRRRG